MSSKIERKNKKNLIVSILQHKCPQCRKGNLFRDSGSYHLKTFMRMNEYCPVCGQRTEIEQGFYYGTGYVSYAIAVAFSAITFIAWWVLIGLSVDDNRVFWWMGCNAFAMILLQPYLMRLSRVVWLSFFVSYNQDWQTTTEAVAVKLVEQKTSLLTIKK